MPFLPCSGGAVRPTMRGLKAVTQVASLWHRHRVTLAAWGAAAGKCNDSGKLEVPFCIYNIGRMVIHAPHQTFSVRPRPVFVQPPIIKSGFLGQNLLFKRC